MINENQKPLVEDVRADNGGHSHFKLIDIESGVILWEETEDEETKPCPFCGSTPTLQDNQNGAYWFSCNGCGAEQSTDRSVDLAIASWNKRIG